VTDEKFADTLDVNNVLEKFNSSKGARRNTCAEFIEKNASKVFETKEFLKSLRRT